VRAHIRALPLAFAAVCLSVSGCTDQNSNSGLVTQPQPLAPIYDSAPAWSPSGATIAYSHLARNPQELANGQNQIWLYDVATRSARFVAPGTVPGWSPAGDSLLFLAGGGIMSYGMTTHATSILLSLGQITSYSWSPTYPQLAVATDYSSPTGATHIWLVPLDGRSPSDISTVGNQGSWHEPRFSPDGNRILHFRFLQNTLGTELFSMDTSGTNAIRLTSDQLYDLDPCWSPNGQSIAYTHGPAGLPAEVWIMATSGSAAHRVVSIAKEPSWSPDGTQLVVTRFLQNHPNLWTVSPDGSNAAPLPGVP
jgi:Tol biopolymer transport system component